MLASIAKGIGAAVAGLLLLTGYFAADYFVFQKSAYEDALDKINHIHGAETCRSIPASTYETFLIFGLSNMQTYYFRSYCFQRVAADTRDEKLCDQVIERKALFLDGSGISPAACRKAVADVMSKDFAERVKPESVHRIANVRTDTAPSGDLEVRVTPAGALWATYRFSVSLLDSSGREIGELYEVDTHLSDRDDVLFTSLQRRKIQNMIAGQNACGKRFGLRIDLKLLRDDKGQLQRSGLSPSQLESTLSQGLSARKTEPEGCR